MKGPARMISLERMGIDRRRCASPRLIQLRPMDSCAAPERGTWVGKCSVRVSARTL